MPSKGILLPGLKQIFKYGEYHFLNSTYMKKYIVLGSLLLLLFLFGCTQIPNFTQEVKYVCADGTTVNDKSLCAATTSQTAPSIPSQQERVDETGLSLEQELSVCSGMPIHQNNSLEQACIMGLAAKHEDVSLCNKLFSEFRRQCYLLLVQVLNKADLCEEAGADKDYCYSEYARISKDASICAKVAEIYSKDSCYSNLASELMDDSLCDDIKIPNSKDNCYSNIASRLQDTSYCDKISNATTKQNCQDNIGGYAQPIRQFK